jgi:internalin A
MLQRQGLIGNWHYRKLVPGQEWRGVIDPDLEASDVILLLVSPDYLASSYSYNTEVYRALEQHKGGEAHVIPIILRPTDWSRAPFGHLQALPTGAKPVTTWSDLDEAWHDVEIDIRRVIEELARSSAS